MHKAFEQILRFSERLSIHELKELRKLIDNMITVRSLAKSEKFSEKRKSKRFEVDANGHGILLRHFLEKNVSKRFNVTVVDVSQEGLRFKTNAKLIEKDICFLNFRLFKKEFKKATVKVLRVSEIENPLNPHFKNYDVGAISVDAYKVESLIIDNNRKTMVSQQLANKASIKILTLCLTDFDTKLQLLAERGFMVVKAPDKDEFIKMLGNDFYSAVILDSSRLGEKKFSILKEVEQMPKNILIIFVGYKENEKINAKMAGANEIVENSISVLDFELLFMKALRNFFASDWNLLVTTKIKAILVSSDHQLSARIEEMLKKIQIPTSYKLIDKKLETSLQELNELDADFIFVDADLLSETTIADVAAQLKKDSRAMIAVSNDRNKRRPSLNKVFDEFISTDDKAEFLLLALKKTFESNKKRIVLQY